MTIKTFARLGTLTIALVSVGSLIAQEKVVDDYQEQYRPQLHFSPKTNWTNDPNGLVLYRGNYHLFYQYNPFGDTWGHMSWGHAVSSDLTHWKELQVAIPEANGIMAFTGSVVIDELNTSGLCKARQECLVAVYTGHSETERGVRQNQNLAFSEDNGATWTPYRANPVIDLQMSDFRDPSVSWSKELGQWLMTVALPKVHKVRFYKSPNLKAWELVSEFGPDGYTAGQWECPDLLWVPPDRPSNQGMYALKVGLNPGALQGGSGEQYFLGNFASGKFTVSKEQGAFGWTNYGKDDYCAISYNGLPPGRKPILIGWMNNWDYAAKLPTSPWRGQMSVPRELSLVKDAAGISLKQEPVVHAKLTRSRTLELKLNVRTQNASSDKLQTPFLLEASISKDSKGISGIRLYTDDAHWTEVAFNVPEHTFYIDRTHAGNPVSEKFTSRTTAGTHPERPLDMRILIDRSSVEAFAQNGTIAMTDLIFPREKTVRIVYIDSDNARKSLQVKTKEYESAWK